MPHLGPPPSYPTPDFPIAQAIEELRLRSSSMGAAICHDAPPCAHMAPRRSRPSNPVAARRAVPADLLREPTFDRLIEYAAALPAHHDPVLVGIYVTRHEVETISGHLRQRRAMQLTANVWGGFFGLSVKLIREGQAQADVLGFFFDALVNVPTGLVTLRARLREPLGLFVPKEETARFFSPPVASEKGQGEVPLHVLKQRINQRVAEMHWDPAFGHTVSDLDKPLATVTGARTREGYSRDEARPLIAAAIAAVPEGLDAQRWRAVVQTIAADDCERKGGPRLLARSFLGDVAFVQPVVVAYAKSRFVFGYDSKVATREALERTTRENDPALTRYLLAYERG